MNICAAAGRRWLWTLLPLLTLGAVRPVHALALGDIAVHSALGQPLAADIPVLLDPGESLRSLHVRLADRAVYRRFNLFYTDILKTLTLQVRRDAAGQPQISISGRASMREPVLDLLLDAGWGGGRMVREYVVLLDLPSSHPVASPAVAPVRRRSPTAKSAAKVSAVATVSGPVLYGPVRRGDTLSGIAHRLKRHGVRTARMMAAIYRANTKAFVGGDMNRLRLGVSLVIPSEPTATRRRTAVAAAAVPPQRSAPRVVSSPAAPASTLQIVTPLKPPVPGTAADALQRQLARLTHDNDEVQAENTQLRTQLAQMEQETRLLAAKVLALPARTPTAVAAAVPTPASVRVAQPSRPLTELVGDVPPSMPMPMPAAAKPWWHDPFWWVVVLAALLILSILTLGALFLRQYRRPQYRDFRLAVKEEESMPFGRDMRF